MSSFEHGALQGRGTGKRTVSTSSQDYIPRGERLNLRGNRKRASVPSPRPCSTRSLPRRCRAPACPVSATPRARTRRSSTRPIRAPTNGLGTSSIAPMCVTTRPRRPPSSCPRTSVKPPRATLGLSGMRATEPTGRAALPLLHHERPQATTRRGRGHEKFARPSLPDRRRHTA